MDVPESGPTGISNDGDEIFYGISLKAAMDEASRCLHCPKPRCRTGCPNNINIPDFVIEIAKGDVLSAAKKLKEQSTMSAICGRVCPQEKQCEGSCVLGLRGKPVAIGALERFAVDYMRVKGLEELPVPAAPTGKRVAVVGAGPAGVTAAEKIALLGHSVEIFEARELPGGVTMYGIPEFRLPREIVFNQIERLEKFGVKIHYGSTIGQSPNTLDDLRNRFDAVFVSTGAWIPIAMGIEGENSEGVYTANEFLARFNLSGSERYRGKIFPISAKHIVTVGGGNVAMDTSRTAIRCGAKSTLVYRRGITEIPARKDEINFAMKEGVDFQMQTMQKRVLVDGSGKVRALECVRMALGDPDETGRRTPVVIPGSEFEIPCDAVVVSIGNKPCNKISSSCLSLKTTPSGTIECDPETLETSLKGVFAGGDIVSGSLTVVNAMVQAKRASESIDRYLRGEPLK